MTPETRKQLETELRTLRLAIIDACERAAGSNDAHYIRQQTDKVRGWEADQKRIEKLLQGGTES